ncbi:CAP domain-containing protein [Bacillus sp. MUM 13]|uniref:CAP domain-containing protein n=1 Tax=Bacillus sp. MUM 13 TaxID=1678001 RepID=UPI0008F5D868|nr:CAP domain-containing protein [Bacillus sp. MUM 13]OIK14776.1 sporulation protein [Bacillus sp. MUM 13]
MKKKMIFSAAAAAAVILSGAGFNQASAATQPCPQAKPVSFQVTNQQDIQKILNQYMKQYNVQMPANAAPQAQQAPQAPQAPKAQQAAPAKQAAPAQQAAPKQEAAKPASSSDSSSLSQYEKEVVDLTNAERTKQGLKPLAVDTELSKTARLKSQDMKDKNYFDHNSPTYGSPFDMMKKFGISYKYAGENIAMGQPTPKEVVTAWMNSEGHRANILNANFTHIGVGYVASGNYWTQQFIGK